MENSKKPSIVSEKYLSKPFGKRFFDGYVRNQNIKKSFALNVSLSIVTVLLTVLWVKLPKNVFANTSIQSISLELERITQITKEMIQVPPLVLKIKIESNNFNPRNYKPSKISVVSFINPNQIPPGAEASAVLLSGATNGMIKAQLTQALKVDGITLLDSGTLLIGEGQSTEERLFVRFNKAVFKNGQFVRISAQGYDLADKILGLKGSRVGDYTLKLAASSGLYFLSGLASGLKTDEIALPGQARRPRLEDAALSGVSTAASEQAKQYLEQMKNKGPVIEVKSGTSFIVTFDGSD